MRDEIIPRDLVARALPWEDLVPALRSAFVSGVTVPERMHVAVLSGTLLVMPAWSQAGLLGLKMATVHPGNGGTGIPAVHATYILVNERTGERICVMDGQELTLRRTAAASALASQILSRTESRTLLMIGSGSLSGPLISAHVWARPIDRVLVWNRTHEHAQDLVHRLSSGDHVSPDAHTRISFEVAGDLDAAVDVADIISCATLSTEPLVRRKYVRSGTHVDLVGAFRPDMRESDGSLLAHARVFVDSRAGATSEAGDILLATQEGLFSPEAIEADLFALCRAPVAPDRAASDITVFKSVGHALEDLVAAELVASRLGLVP